MLQKTNSFQSFKETPLRVIWSYIPLEERSCSRHPTLSKPGPSNLFSSESHQQVRIIKERRTKANRMQERATPQRAETLGHLPCLSPEIWMPGLGHHIPLRYHMHRWPEISHCQSLTSEESSQFKQKILLQSLESEQYTFQVLNFDSRRILTKFKTIS